MKKKFAFDDPKLSEPLDAEEAEIMAELDREEWVSVSPEEFAKRKKEAQLAARNTLKKTERATIRLTKMDMEGLKLMAADEGMPYQTLISSILHKAVTGQIKL